jgi:epsilon-lactone hydrolase
MSNQQQLELNAMLRQGPLDLEADVATLRAAFNDLMAQIPVAGDVDHVPTTVGGVNAEDVTIRGIDTANTILYFHGGVYVIGSAATSVPLASDLARRARRRSTMPAPPTRDFSPRALTPGRSLSPATRPVAGWRWPLSSR